MLDFQTNYFKIELNNYLIIKIIMHLLDFLKHYKITFVLSNPHIDTYRVAEYIKEKLGGCNLSYDIPDENNSEIMIIVPTNGQTINRLHHNNFLRNNFLKFPKSIIVVLGFKELLQMNLSYFDSLSEYKIPFLYFNPLNRDFNLEIELVSIESYNTSLEYNKDNNVVHALNFETFIDSIDKTNKIYCYYTSENEELWKLFIERYTKIISMYELTNVSLNVEMQIN